MVRPTSGTKTKARGKRAPGSRLTQSEVDEIFRRFQHLHPHPKTELHYRDPFTLLVAVVLSAQATDASVNRVTPELFRIADTPEKLAALGEAGLEDQIKTIGIYRNKARNLIALANKLIAEHGGKVPSTREMLETLPGVGRKTANVVLNIAFGQTDHRHRHPCLQGGQPHRPGPRQDPARGRGDAEPRSCPSATSTTPITG